MATATFFVTVVIPIWDKEKDNQIADLKKEPATLKSEREQLAKQLEIVEGENRSLRRDLDRLTPDSLLTSDDPYPRGYRAVRIGDRISRLSETYGGDNKIEDEEGYVTVTLAKPGLFRQITYYYDGEAVVKTVTSVLFFFADDKTGFTTMKQELINKFGQNGMKEVTKGHLTSIIWPAANGYELEIQYGHTYWIKRKR